MLTIDRIIAKCKEDGDCLIWQGKTNGKGQPVGYEHRDGKTVSVTIRRRAYEAYHPRHKLTKDDRVTTCGHPGCLAREHLSVIDRSEQVRRMHAVMDAGTRLKRSQTLAAVQQAINGKLTPEQVQAVRDSTDGPYVTAKRLGISGTVASRIQRGVSYRVYQASPFAGLGAM